MGVLCVEHANVLELCYIELLSGDSSPYSILSAHSQIVMLHTAIFLRFSPWQCVCLVLVLSVSTQ